MQQRAGSSTRQNRSLPAGRVQERVSARCQTPLQLLHSMTGAGAGEVCEHSWTLSTDNAAKGRDLLRHGRLARV